MKLLFKLLLATLLLSVFTKSTFAQKNPDTLVIGTKNGQIILVSDSLLKFAPMETEELIRKALYKIKDTIPKNKNTNPFIKNGLEYTKIIKKRAISITADFGVGLIMGKIAPVSTFGLEFAPQKQDYYLKKNGMYTFLSLKSNSSYLFKEVDNKHQASQNIFLEFTLGNRMNPNGGSTTIGEISSGVGYLVYKEGNYFEKNTFKVFINFGLPNSSIIFTPDLYFINKKTIPGLTVKVVNLGAIFNK